MRYFALVFFLLINLFSINAYAVEDKVLNVYNWSNYISDNVLKKFTQETGIKVNYSTYDSNETLYAKLIANPQSGYDVIVPSSYYVDKMIAQGMLKKIDKTQISNFTYLNPALLNKSYDPQNQFSIPYSWTLTGIVVNTQNFPLRSVQTWNDLWKPLFKNKILLLDDVREVFSIALISLHYSPNDRDPQHIKEAYLKLKQLMPNVQIFNVDGFKTLYMDGDLTIGMGWNGEIYKANLTNPNIQFIYPREGYIMSIDSMAIPKGAQHVQNALKFMNFIMRPDIAKQISLETGYATPNLAAQKMLPPSITANPIAYPDKEILQKAIVQTDVGNSINVYEKYWELLKSGG